MEPLFSEGFYRWCLETVSGRNRPDAKEAFAQVARAGQHLAYHNADHVAHTLEVAHRLAQEADLSECEWATVSLALFHHDQVVVPVGADNEERSAEATARFCDDPEVERLILLTKRHEIEPGDRLGNIVVDADLAILASDHEDYIRYANGIATEYGHLSDEEYSRGRSRFLRSMLNLAERGRLYHSPLISSEAAIRNMELELARLPRRRK